MVKTPISKTLGWLVIVFAVALVGFLYFLYLDTNDQLDLSSMDGNWMVGVKHKTTTAVPSDWKTYTNSQVGFSFRYPKNWSDVKLNVIKNPANSQPGSYLGTYDGTKIAYFDPDKIFSFVSNSKDYVPGVPLPDLGFTKTKVKPNWTAAELKTAMGWGDYLSVLGVKKLNNKAILVADYSNIECSPIMRLSVVAPLTDNYPNLEITIEEPFQNNQAIKDYEKNYSVNNSDPCDHKAIYQTIADKIMAGTYSDKMTDYIKTAGLIAGSIK